MLSLRPLVLALLLLPCVALPCVAGAQDYMQWPTLQGAKKSKPAPGTLFADDANTISHVYFDGTHLVDKKANSWTMNGTVPQVAASGKVPPGAGPFSDVNYYSLGTGSDVLDFTGDFYFCFALLVTAADISATHIWFSNGTFGTDGYFSQGDNANGGVRWNLSGGSVGTNLNTTNAYTAGRLMYACGGRTGITEIVQLDTVAAVTTAAPTKTAATTTPARIGRYSGTGFAFGGTVVEMIWEQATPSGATFSSIISAAKAKAP